MSINRIYNIQEWKKVSSATGSTPSAGFEFIYPKNDGNWYHMGSDTNEKLISLAYNLGNGFTYSLSTSSSIYNYDVSLPIDNYGITISNGILRVGFITASNLSQNGNGTASYVLSVDSSGIPTWVPNTTIQGLTNFVPKFNSTTSLTNSNIYDDGTTVIIGSTTSNLVGGFNPKLYVAGNVDIANRLYFTSSSIYLSGDNNTSKLSLNSLGFVISNGTYVLYDTTFNASTGHTLNLLNGTFRITATGSSNTTSSIIVPTITTIGIGTASPTHLLHIYATQSALRLVDGSQNLGKFLLSDSNGVASWYSGIGNGLTSSGYTFSVFLQTNSGLTVSNSGLGIQLQTNSGLTVSTFGLSLNPNSIGAGLTFTGGSISVTSVAVNILAGNGLTNSGSTFSVNLATNSGLTFSNGFLLISPQFANSGLTISGGSISVTSIAANVVGTPNYIAYYLNSSTLTASVIFQTASNILIGTTTDVGSKLHIAGSFSSTNDGSINSAKIGRGLNAANLVFGNSLNLNNGINNIVVGDNSFNTSGSGFSNIAIGSLVLKSLTSGNSNIGIGNNSLGSISAQNNNIAVGISASHFAGGESVAIGNYSGHGGFGNISVGFKSGGYAAANIYGGYNVFLGYQSGTNFTGSYSVFIGGYDSSLSTSNNIFISDGQGNLRIYSPSTGNILIGTMSDAGSKLYVAGSVSIVSNSPGAFRLVDTTQGLGKFLLSDDNGVAGWYSGIGNGLISSGYTFSILLNNNSGLTVSGLGLSTNIGTGLTLSNNFIIINPSIAGSALTYSNGVLSSLISTGNGLTSSGNVFSANIATGLTLSNNFIIINPNIAGSTLTYSNGVLNSLISSGIGLTSSGNTFSANIGVGLTLSNNFIIINPNIAGSTLTYSNGVLNTLVSAGSGLTSSGNTLSTNIGVGLTLSNNFIILNPSVAGSTLTYSNGILNTLVSAGNGLTSSGNTFSVNLRALSGLTVSNLGLGISLDTNSGLTISSNGILINSNIAGYGLTYSAGSMSFTTNINSTQGYIPYFITTTSLTSSVIYQTSSNILIGTVSNNGARLQIAGSMSIISATGNAFRLVDGTQGAGKVLESDANGFASWQSYKYSGTQSFTANLSSVVSHNLNTMFYIIQLFDYTTGEEILGGYTNRGLTQATITLTQDVNNCGVVIMG